MQVFTQHVTAADGLDRLMQDVQQSESTTTPQSTGRDAPSAVAPAAIADEDNAPARAKPENVRLLDMDMSKFEVLPKKEGNEYFESRYGFTPGCRRVPLIQSPKWYMKFNPTTNIHNKTGKVTGHTLRAALLDVRDNKNDPAHRVKGTPIPDNAKEGTKNACLSHDKLLEMQESVVKQLFNMKAYPAHFTLEKAGLRMRPFVSSKYDDAVDPPRGFPATVAFSVFGNHLNITSSSGAKYKIEDLSEPFIPNNPNKKEPLNKFVSIGFTIDRVPILNPASATNKGNFMHSIRATARSMHIFDDQDNFEDAEIDVSLC